MDLFTYTLCYVIRYNTFSPEVVKKMPKSDLVEEVKLHILSHFILNIMKPSNIWNLLNSHQVRRLQAALSEQTDISKQEYEKLQDVIHPPIFLEFVCLITTMEAAFAY